MEPVRTGRYYTRELVRRLAHYATIRRNGYHDHGSLEQAATTILAERAAGGFEAGGHFDGVWPRDLCFGARGIVAAGYGDVLADTADQLVAELADAETFYTDFHPSRNAATPAEGADTFPALVCLLAATGGLQAHADAIVSLAERHRERFVDERTGLVTGTGSGWWDSAARAREAYNTAMLLAAVVRLEEAGLETTFTGDSSWIRDALDSQLWNGDYFDEHRDSETLACDANVVPLYFRLVDDDRAASIVDALGGLERSNGLCLRAQPFSHGAVHPFFLLHRDYHYHVWPWNSFMYAIGLEQYGFEDRAKRELERVERVLGRYGTFLECYTLAGEPYVKRGYASAGHFTVAAALWTEYRCQFDPCCQ
ncbi:hypothetical protein G6M89_17535 [Natronolimnobius sp. AArcel1]|nr:hypothetical protein [Natronolimnobius sp. AArcel1]